ncbi:MAG: polyhydroxyalkanoic acid system family protein [Chitinophagaceae bacterium]
MSKLTVNVPHNLSQQEALTRIKKLLTGLKEQHKGMVTDVKENWNGNNGNFEFSAKGFDVAGLIDVKQSSVDIDADLPFALSLFKGSISKVISDKAAQLLS